MFRPSLAEMDHPAPSSDRLSRRMRRELGWYRPAAWDSPTATPDGCTADAGQVAPTYGEMPEPGIVCWLSCRDVERARLRSALVIGALLVLAGLWLSTLASDESDREQVAEHQADRSGDDTVSGVVILELFTLVPLGFAVSRRARLGRLRDHMSSIGAAEQEESIAELAKADEVVWRLARPAAELPVGPACGAATAAYWLAERASRSWRTLILRRTHPHILLVLTADGARPLANACDELESQPGLHES